MLIFILHCSLIQQSRAKGIMSICHQILASPLVIFSVTLALCGISIMSLLNSKPHQTKPNNKLYIVFLPLLILLQH